MSQGIVYVPTETVAFVRYKGADWALLRDGKNYYWTRYTRGALIVTRRPSDKAEISDLLDNLRDALRAQKVKPAEKWGA